MTTATRTLADLLDADGRPIRPEPGHFYRVAGMLTRAEWRDLERMRQSQYFLVKNDGSETGERWKCNRCGAAGPNAHPYFTAWCVELPYRGLKDALYRYVQVSHDEYMRQRLMPYIPNLAETDRATARSLRPKVPGAEFYAIALGLAVPLTTDEARTFAERMSMRAGYTITL